MFASSAFLILTIVVLILIKWISRRVALFKTFKNLGIPGPQPSFFYGNLKDFKSKGHSTIFQEWTKQYGPTLGYFMGCRPHLLTSDVKLLRRVLMEESSTFHMRADMNLLHKNHPIAKHEVPFVENYQHWRRLRQSIAGSFSNVALREMLPMIEDCVQKFLTILTTESNFHKNGIEINGPLRRLALDNVSRAAFGIDADIQNKNNPLPPLLRKANLYLDNFQENPWEFLLLCVRLPAQNIIFPILEKFKLLEFHGNPMYEEVSQFLKARMALENDTRKDLMKNLLDARVSSDGNVVRLSINEVTANTAINYIAGFDTTSTSMTIIFYRLAQHPEWQVKLLEEVAEIWKDDIDLGQKLKASQELKLMDCFIKESLRMHAPVPALVSRRSSKSFVHDGVIYPADITIQANIHQIHYDPANYPDPHEFKPERFLDKKIGAVTWLAFGEGSRNCVGMRFALLQIKILLVHLLRRYEVVATPQVEEKGLRLVDKAFFIQPQELFVDLRPRMN